MKQSLREIVLQTEHVTGCLSGTLPHLIPLGIARLDNTFGGMSPGAMGVIGALDGIGKSTLALHMALERAKQQHKTAIISTQDPPDVVGMRMLSYLTGINSLKIRRGDCCELDRARIIRAAGLLEENPYIEFYFPSSQLSDVLKDVEEAAEHADLIFVDYLQNLHINGARADRRIEIDTMLHELQQRAFEKRVSVMLLSQMRKLPPRNGSKDEDTPFRDYTRSDLKESGAIGETARLVLILERDRHDHGLLHCHVDKATWGGDNVTASFRRAPHGLLEPV